MKGKVFGLEPKVALAIALAVGLGVFWYIRKHNAGIPTQTQTTPQVSPSQYPQDQTGGVSQGPDVSALLAALQSLTTGYTQPSNYYNAPYQSPSTNTYTTNYTGATPPVSGGSVNPAAPSVGALPNNPSFWQVPGVGDHSSSSTPAAPFAPAGAPAPKFGPPVAV